MGFWIFMTCCNFLIPFLMIVFGYFFKNFGAGSINAVFGYRTKRSMKNQNTWDFANSYFARLWIKIGWIMLPITILLMLPVIGKEVDVIGTYGGIITTVEIVVLLASIIPVENAIKKEFDENGNPNK